MISIRFVQINTLLLFYFILNFLGKWIIRIKFCYILKLIQLVTLKFPVALLWLPCYYLLIAYLRLYFSYLELAILPCWRYLLDQPADSLQRLVQMTRGIGDPLAYAYCCLFMAHSARKLPSCDAGILLQTLYCILLILLFREYIEARRA